VDKVPKPMDIDPTDTIENVKKCILKNKDIPLDQQVFVIVQDYDHGITGLLDVLVWIQLIESKYSIFLNIDIKIAICQLLWRGTIFDTKPHLGGKACKVCTRK